MNENTITITFRNAEDCAFALRCINLQQGTLDSNLSEMHKSILLEALRWATQVKCSMTDEEAKKVRLGT